MNLLLYRLRQLYNSSIIGITWPLVLLVSYTLLGALIFRNLELEKDQKQRLLFREKTEYAFSEVVNRLLKIKCPNNISSNSDKLTNDVNTTYQTFQIRDSILFFVDHLNLTDIIEDRMGPSPWTIMGSMFYAGQLYTTIGYGNPVAKTNYGKLASIIYIMIGIPLFLIILKKIGKILSETLTKIYQHYMYARKQLPSAKKNLIRKASMKLNKKIDNNNVTTISEKVDSDISETVEETLSTNTEGEVNDFPILLALLIMIIWIAFSAALFCIWETEWPYLTSVYFFFVSISTVGLGDIVPSKFDMIFVNFLLILIGLALLSMCINLIQTAIEKLLNDLLDEYINEIEKIGQQKDESNDLVIFSDEKNELHIKNDKKLERVGKLADWGSKIFKTWMEQNLIKQIGFVDMNDDNDSIESIEKTPTPMSKFNHHKLIPKGSLKKKLSSIKKYHDMPYFLRTSVLSKILIPEHFESLEEFKAHDVINKSNMVTSSCQTDEIPNPISPYDNTALPLDRNDILSIYSSACEGSLLSVAYNDVNYGYSNETLTNLYKTQQDNGVNGSLDDARSCYSMSYANTPMSFRKMLNGEIINQNTGINYPTGGDSTVKKKTSLVHFNTKK
uniref:Potassium channel subfamily K member 18 n=1 Tax=Parastrongyloides trichosuri TaxID=131310 RepID=A0A0N4ZYR4_PARTI